MIYSVGWPYISKVTHQRIKKSVDKSKIFKISSIEYDHVLETTRIIFDNAIQFAATNNYMSIYFILVHLA